METKFKIVETEEYTLAVSDGVKAGDKSVLMVEGFTPMILTHFEPVEEGYEGKKIIGYKPKGNAPELDLPLLPNIEPSWFNKVEYTEYDLNKAVNLGLTLFEFFQSLKQPKWFVAEMKHTKSEVFRENDNVPYAVLKTTTINNKTYLVGTYLN